MRKEIRFLYGFLCVLVLSITTIGATYAYWTASTSSSNNAVQTSSTIYTISMKITPIYSDFSIIPMNDEDALKAIKNECKDKYNRGACSAYLIHVYDYSDTLEYVSGVMDVYSDNMMNLSYMMLREQDTYDENNCVQIEEKSYCIVKEATPAVIGEKLSLGDTYKVFGTTETDFVLLLWLSNLQFSQNETDIGSFKAAVTMQAGNGGVITGTISSVVQVNPDPVLPEDGTDNVEETEPDTGTGGESSSGTESNTGVEGE